MPNWCYNMIEISGTPEAMQQFRQTLNTKGAEFSFSQTVPRPSDEELQKYAKYTNGMPGWYNWSYENWGTKWDVDDDADLWENPDGTISIQCQTAWSPPNAWAKHVTEMFPGLSIEIHYKEYGMQFQGVYHANIDDAYDSDHEFENTEEDYDDEDDGPVGEAMLS